MRSESKRFAVADLVWRNVGHYWRTNVAVVLGCAVAVAALVGSLLVGDSVRGSLRDIALERLGDVEYTVESPGKFFREQLAADLLASLEATAVSPGSNSSSPADSSSPAGAAELRRAGLRSGTEDFATPALLLDGSVRASSGAVVPGVSVVGVPPAFLGAADGSRAPALSERRVAVNSSLAGELGAAEGDWIFLTVGRRARAPTDSIFAYRSRAMTTRVLRLVIARIIPSRGIGAFSLRQDPSSPRNLYVSPDWLQAQLGQPSQANMILIGRRSAAHSTVLRAALSVTEWAAHAGDRTKALAEALAASVRLADYGLRLAPNPAHGYFALKSDEVTLPRSAVARAQRVAADLGMSCRPSSVYLANTLAVVSPAPARKSTGGHGNTIPYSVVAGVVSPAETPAGPLLVAGQEVTLGADDILLNAWAEEDLGARVGDRIEMTYYAGDERGPRTRQQTFVLRGVVAMEGPALDKGLAPAFEGVTDSATIAGWNPPFPMDLKRIRRKDETYWKEYGATPKAFLALEVVERFWGAMDSGSGVTSVALKPPEGMTMEAAAGLFEKAFLRAGSPSELGFSLVPQRRNALAAAGQATDFGVIFLSMSLFIVAAAALMVGLLLRLAVERRASELGIMLATGFSWRGAAVVLAGEGVLLGAAGVVLGAPGGVGYAWLIIHALRTWWSGAVGNLDLRLHASAASVVLGSAGGFLVSAAAVLWAMQLLRRTPTLALLAGWRAMTARPRRGLHKRALGIAVEALALAGGLLLLGLLFSNAAEGLFPCAGALLLTGFLALVCARLLRAGETPAESVSLRRLSWRGASRNWLRSLLTVGLLACASFVVVTVAANRKDLSRTDAADRRSGAGGFSLVARSDVPIFANLNTVAGREALGFPPEVARAGELAESRFFPFRMTSGDDASCLNIQRPVQPRVLGVPHELVERGGFRFAATAEKSENPWRLLEGDEKTGESPALRSAAAMAGDEESAAIPAFADATSAEWVLHVALGGEVSVADASGKPARLRIVGLLADSIFAGELLVSDAQFRRHFGEGSGCRFFLIETPRGAEAAVAGTLRENLGEMGFDVRRSSEVLARYARVQNTYLATFQTLGGLGLLLGAFGIVTVVLRSVVERRSELAMLLALGLRRRQLIAIIVIEHGMLLLLGLAVGSSAALVAAVPHMISTMQPRLRGGLADVNWLSLGGMLFTCAFAGVLTCLLAAAIPLRREELLPALRSE